MNDGLEAGQLLAHADRLVGSSDGANQIDFRRAVSAAYYAVFHAVAIQTTTQILGAATDSSPTAAARLLTRRVSHTAIARAGLEVERLREGVPGHAATPRRRAARDVLEVSGTGAPPDDLVLVAAGLRVLREQREAADYDRDAQLSRRSAVGAVDLARTVLATLTARADTGSFRGFLALIALQGR